MPPGNRQVTWLLAALGAAWLAAPGTAGAQPVHGPTAAAGLYPSVILFHKPHHDDGPAQVRHVAELGFRKVQVVVTLQCELDQQRNVVRYGRARGWRMSPLDEQSLAEFREALRQTFAAVAAERMQVAIVAHLNSAGRIDDWRNHFRFDPLAEYDGYSYQTAVIDSIADAAAAELPADAVVDFSLCGEMGRSVFEHADSYQAMIDRLRQREKGPHWRLGVSLNFDGPASELEPTEEQSAAVTALLGASDLVGISEYRWFDLPPDPGDFAAAVEQFYAAMDQLGVHGHRTLPLHFSEVGLGGGSGGNRPAKTPADAALKPWEGVATPRNNPWTTDEMRDFRRAYHAALLGFLADPPDGIPVTDAFLWSELSWDPLDVIDRGFADEAIAAAIRTHNAAVSEQ
ncbi:MAG: hypothetical protein KDA44_17055 [Planctomycetales bacterium]|nr:hypothetical protein [Planctomycetales bacterium]